MFRKIGLITKPNNNLSKEAANKLQDFLHKKGIDALFYQQDIKEQAELIIVLGGDGTFLAAARTFATYEIPLLGVNLGRLGFLTDIDPAIMFNSIEDVLSGKYNTEERFLLECNFAGKDDKYLALNDIVVHRGTTARMVNSNIYLNNVFVNKGLSDGLIISTPTGSTAYALSSGGPILNMGVEAISLTYISPHAMSYRPFIFSANDEVKICLEEPQTGASLIFDGQETIPLDAMQNVFIRKYPKPIKLIHPHNYDFFAILRDKLHWNK